MSPELVVVLAGRDIGRVLRDNRGRLTFVYAEDWRQTRGAYPLSLSMPLAAAEHGHKPVEAFLWNLLPDNDAVLARWGQRFRCRPATRLRSSLTLVRTAPAPFSLSTPIASTR